ncbi:MAG TPA: choice-of-anchor V domain-containing protein [Bryobacteraceae bacterium]|nr:choice-of-anchor V domain-containing protein [Bryobacteraceae bacterium]
MERKRKLFWAKAGVVMGAIPLVIWAYEYGPDPGVSGVPGENGTCAQAGCHTGTANDPNNRGAVTVTFPNGLTYTPGVKQHLSVTISDPATTQKAWGFELTARLATTPATMTGTFASTDANTQLMCSQPNLFVFQQVAYSAGSPQTCPTGETLQYMEHSPTGYNSTKGTGSGTFQFDWTPPATNVGNVTVYVAGNAANGDLTANGDHIYTTTYTLTPQAAGNPPTISGVTASASGAAQISPNAYVNIKGANLSTVTDDWSQHVTNGVLPQQLDGVSVLIGGKPAYVQSVSSGLIQVLTPPNLGLGSVAVTVTTSVGTSSPLNVTSQTYTPAFFPWPSNQPIATHTDYSYAAKNGTIAGMTTVPIKPGEYVILWVTGFGPTNPAIPSGTAVPLGTIYYVTTQPTLTLNSQPMAYYATALSPTFAGLYQVVAQVPASMPNGDWPIIATVAGVSSPTGVLLTVQR